MLNDEKPGRTGQAFLWASPCCIFAVSQKAPLIISRMIKSVRLVNFFSFRDVEISLNENLTVLVGLNSSGKTNLLRGLQLLRAGMNGQLLNQIIKWGGFDAIFCHSKNGNDSSNTIQIEFVLGYKQLIKFGYKFQQDIHYCVHLVKKGNADYYVNEEAKSEGGFIYLNLKNGSGVVYDRESDVNSSAKRGGLKRVAAKKDNVEAVEEDIFENLNSRELWLGQVNNAKRFPGATALSKALHSVEVYTEFDTSENSEMRRAMAPTGYEQLLPNGSNLFQVLNTINLNSTEAFDRIEDALKEVNPHFRRLRPVVYGNGVFEMQVQEDQLRVPTSAAHLSDGTLRYLCLLAITLNPLASAIIALDEPERGLHPDMILQIYQYLEQCSEQRQIIITTHLPGLLNQFPLHTVRVFEKDAYNQTQVKQFTEEQFEGWYDGFVPGEMWRNGDLGGNRY